MKLKKIIDRDNLQAYSISSPSKQFKLRYPFKYTFIMCMNGMIKTYNTNKIPTEFAFIPMVGYIFTYEKSLPDFFSSNSARYLNYGSTYPSCLDQFFTSAEGDDKKIDLILSCTGRNKEVPLTFKDSLVVRCNSKELASGKYDSPSKNIQTNVLNIVNTALNENIDADAEAWTLNIMQNIPLNDNGYPLRYPKTIDDSMFDSKKMKKLTQGDVFIEYDFRAESYDAENSFISSLEEAFEDMNAKIEVFNTYNNVLKDIKEEMTKKGMKFKQLTDYSIETTLGDLRKLTVKFQLTDFI